MDASAYLTRQGWQGDGHSLHPNGRGIKKPLLISRKPNLFGVGKKKNDTHTDQWWARALDDSLKGLDVSKSENPDVMNSIAASRRALLGSPNTTVGKWGRLYDGFVRGEGLNGTILLDGFDKESSHEQTRIKQHKMRLQTPNIISSPTDDLNVSRKESSQSGTKKGAGRRRSKKRRAKGKEKKYGAGI